MNRRLILWLAATAATALIAACGRSSSSSSQASSAPASSGSSSPPASTTSPGTVLTLAADPSGALKFTKSSLTAPAGKVTIRFTNNSPVEHNVTVQQGTSGPVLGATPTFSGGTKTLTIQLKAGKYTYYCSVPGHRAAGMLGTLTVQ